MSDFLNFIQLLQKSSA